MITTKDSFVQRVNRALNILGYSDAGKRHDFTQSGEAVFSTKLWALHNQTGDFHWLEFYPETSQESLRCDPNLTLFKSSEEYVLGVRVR